MTRGKKKENIGLCNICGENANENTSVFRKLNAETLAKAYKGPEAVTIRINDQLCQQHYNQFVMYIRNKVKSSNKHKNNRDSGYYKSGWPQKRV